jgi:dipeptidyl aminopeptidase/acylaminoacyl peptidase
MYWKILTLSLTLTLSAFAQSPSSSGKHPFTFEDMMALKRVGAPVPSPDGKWVVFDCEDVDLAANTKISHLWIVPATGGESRRLNPTPNHEERPRFSPDGKRLIWTSKATDPTQTWMCDFDPQAGQLIGKPHQVTSISTGAVAAIWSPDGKNIVFVSAVYPDCKDDACNKQRDEELKKSKVKAKIFSRLFYRHWNAFTEFKRSHLFVQNVEAGVSPAEIGNAAGTAATTPRDLTPGDHDVPPFSLGGQDMYGISPDGQELAYTSNIDEVEATSTNNEIFVVPISGGTPKKISTSPGSDTTPLYSPDGRYLAWRSQARARFEADKWRLLLQDRQSGKTRDLTEKFDRSVGSFAWTEVSKDHPTIIFFTAEDHGESPLFAAFPSGQNPIEGEPTKTPLHVHADDLSFAGGRLFFTRMSAVAPNEIWKYELRDQLAIRFGEPWEAVTHMNDALSSKIDMQPMESCWF